MCLFFLCLFVQTMAQTKKESQRQKVNPFLHYVKETYYTLTNHHPQKYVTNFSIWPDLLLLNSCLVTFLHGWRSLSQKLFWRLVNGWIAVLECYLKLKQDEMYEYEYDTCSVWLVVGWKVGLILLCMYDSISKAFLILLDIAERNARNEEGFVNGSVNK